MGGIFRSAHLHSATTRRLLRRAIQSARGDFTGGADRYAHPRAMLRSQNSAGARIPCGKMCYDFLNFCSSTRRPHRCASSRARRPVQGGESRCAHPCVTHSRCAACARPFHARKTRPPAPQLFVPLTSRRCTSRKRAPQVAALADVRMIIHQGVRTLRSQGLWLPVADFSSTNRSGVRCPDTLHDRKVIYMYHAYINRVLADAARADANLRSRVRFFKMQPEPRAEPNGSRSAECAELHASLKLL